MILKSGNVEAVEIDTEVFKTLLTFYPEERLTEYGVFKSSLDKGSITLTDLINSSERVHLPWQMFMLDMNTLRRELDNIEKHRSDKFPAGVLMMHKRKGSGSVTSKRIIDRQIRIQSFVSGELPNDYSCDFIGSLKGKTVDQAVSHIFEYFQIDTSYFRSRDSALESKDYLIERVQSRNNINISQGVKTNGLLPEIRNTLEIFRNTSGFVVQDSKIPFIFLPSEINPEENHYRQIYTLLYLVVVIGMEAYSHAIENFSIKTVREDKLFKKINLIVSEILLPEAITGTLNKDDLSKKLINNLKEEYKISYSAIVFILRMRKIMDSSQQELFELPIKEPSPISEVKEWFSHPHIHTSVRKFCGSVAFDRVSSAIRSHKIYPNQAQMIVFGRFRKEKWIEFRQRI